MFKLLVVLSVFAFAYTNAGVVVAPAVSVVPVHGHVAHVSPVVHHGAHQLHHAHVIHHPAPVKTVVAHPVAVHHAPVVPIVPVHHAHHAVIAHH